MSCFSAAIHRGFEIHEPQSNSRVGKPGANSGKCTIIGGSEFGIMGWYRAGANLNWGFTKESLQDATHTPKTSLICGPRPPNIVDLPEFKGRLTTSTRYHDCRRGGKRISRQKKHLRGPCRTTRGVATLPRAPEGQGQTAIRERPIGGPSGLRPCAE